MKKYFPHLIFFTAFLGILDAGYLTMEHYKDMVPPCAVGGLFNDCGAVLRSEYATIIGIPLALIGLVHYSIFAGGALAHLITRSKLARYWLIVQSVLGLLASAYFMYIQVFLIGALCLYCTLSAVISTILFILVHYEFSRERKILFLWLFGHMYRTIVKPFLFLFDAEKVHVTMIALGQRFGGNAIVRKVVRSLVSSKQPALTQTIVGIPFHHPIGLAAGFDYEAMLTRSLDVWGFGWQTVGTITNGAYEGNMRPMLGRLPKSRALLVNKGFKNLGADATIMRLGKLKHHTHLQGVCNSIPYGISIGRTNSLELNTQKKSVEDIVFAFTKFEQSALPHSYYELNISCPNLKGDVEFYTPAHLEELLIAVDELSLRRPVFVKMPIEKPNSEVEAMLAVIAKYSPKGVIFGNLQKDRQNPCFDSAEIVSVGKGNFSGKPTYERSNELIRLAYRQYKDRFVIVGCGGIFSAEDAYTKIKLGASLLQLITGMIYQGPQLVAQINMGLEELLKRDGYTHISEAIGANS
ncbi:MAG TPA: quinone-dependent dihydroorotate dehydrogenase [Candidatus Woesebacteria bacterium]|nr:quinone-dependent dihydroorotate dehydrogenase [Candidatus Woesebacteria bacterium]HNS94910.1 quinone-dependent dihydroorotate dehydrogenase [Candidatus Woesebacteria bacterium]